MVRMMRWLVVVLLLAAACGSTALALDGYPVGLRLGWTNRYYPTYRCPTGNYRPPFNLLVAVPLNSSLGVTGPRKMLTFPPIYGSPLYNQSPRMVAYPPSQRPCPGVNCPY